METRELHDNELEQVAGGASQTGKAHTCPRCGASGGKVQRVTAVKWYCKKCKDYFTA